MSNDVSRVYQFLALHKDWQDVANTNGDAAITKTEFRNYLNDNFDWDGETTEAGKNDLINSFWKEVDTIVSGKVNGSKLKNKNALDSKEIGNMETKIKLYEELNDYTSTLSAPSFINNSSNWLKSVSEGLANLVEKEYKGTAEALEAWLDSENRASKVMAKATADYCANEYIADVMADVSKDYGYAYGSDNTLQGMINSYIGTLEEYDVEEIQDKIHSMIDAYMSTADLNNQDIEGLAEFGYKPTDKSPLNDLQKSILQSKLEKAVTSGEMSELYEKNKEMFDNAMTTFMDELKYGDFNNANNDILTAFKSSEAYQKVEKAIQTKDIFTGSELKSTLTKELGESFADRLGNIMKGEIPAYDKIVEEAVTKAQNGDFDVNGKLDTEKVITWIVEQMRANLVDFYPNGLGDMPLEELNTMYDALVASAREKQDASKIKEAAISYCKTISAKGAALAQAVKDVFGDNYASEINKMLTGDIETKMNELKAKVLELGDPANCTLSSWSTSASESLALMPGNTYTYSISANITNGKDSISPDRITYSVNNSNATFENGVLTIKTPNADANFEVKIYAMVDGVKVGEPKTIKVTCKQKDGSNLNSEHNVLVNGEFVDDLIKNHNKTMKISGFHRNGDNSLSDSKAEAKSTIQNLLQKLATDLISAGYNSTKVNMAVTTTYNYYAAAIDAITDQKYSDNDKGSCSMNFSYVDSNGKSCSVSSSYYQHTRKHEKNADWDEPCKTMSINSTGIQMNESYNKTNTYNFYLNTGILLNKFMSFLKI